MHSWDKEQREIAKAKGRVLFAASIDGSTKKGCVTGKYCVWGPETEGRARLAFFFCLALRNGETPQQAFKMGLKAMDTKPAKKGKGRSNGQKV